MTVVSPVKTVGNTTTSIEGDRGLDTRQNYYQNNYKNENTRISNGDALSLWHRVTLDSVLGDAPDLTARQFALLTTVYLEGGPHTVRSLAARLDVTKAVITRALDTLAGYGFVERGPDVRDKRSIIIMRTARGSHFLTGFAETIRAEMKLGQIKSVAA